MVRYILFLAMLCMPALAHADWPVLWPRVVFPTTVIVVEDPGVTEAAADAVTFEPTLKTVTVCESGVCITRTVVEGEPTVAFPRPVFAPVRAIVRPVRSVLVTRTEVAVFEARPRLLRRLFAWRPFARWRARAGVCASCQ